jgi:DNA-binding Xre family transcriptional regulator
MEKVSRKKISISKLLGLSSKDAADQKFLSFKDLLAGLHEVMVEKGISMNELARRMKISRQAVYQKFSGKNTSMEWIQRACIALGVEIKVAYLDQGHSL